MKDLKKGDMVLCDGDINRCSYLTKGKEYKFVRYSQLDKLNDMITIVHDGGREADYMAYRFSKVNKLDAEKILSEYREACSWKDEKVIDNYGDIHVVKDVKLFIAENTDSSNIINEFFNHNGYAIGICYGTCSVVPHTTVKLAPERYIVELNSSYKAEVFEDKVVVGCQTFTREKIEELYHTFDKFN